MLPKENDVNIELSKEISHIEARTFSHWLGICNVQNTFLYTVLLYSIAGLKLLHKTSKPGILKFAIDLDDSPTQDLLLQVLLH